ncbi:CelD/BcsL family acetyltransferase involved in cellulose biosynthesis [Archangium gephyra]|uniref:CelD/BcsL family acetyltransferase involved in cellulose biosynthesis n=1 Tax=Archangium gephyra TaxID=48 RepID=A0AAC8QBN3_9BACT|nr:GNAT family N-acetyltransferase [Archangium gephyra]AKJ04653.1 Cellulose biosynthesis protein [Archangium gephyra]REG37287.1 CelD/BcsL family acetyltransferase involved in cellulose biosynthesis [Archangium gephyra]
MIHEAELSPTPSPAQWLEVGTVRELSQLAGLRGAWSDLLDASNAGPFNAWEWLYPWCRRIGADRKPFVLQAKDRTGALVGLMPLGFEYQWVLGRPVRRLAFLGETHVGSDYLDVVARRGREEEVARVFAEALWELRDQWDVLDLTDLREDSVTVRVLRETFEKHRADLRMSTRYVCPYESLSKGETFDGFLRRTSRRDNFLRRKKWLEKQEGYRIEKTEAPGALAGPLTDFFRLHSARWESDGGSQGIRGSGVESFHRDATQLLAERGRLRLYTMKVGGQAVASVYGILHRDAFIYFQSGYDPAWRNRSVGLVLVGETFKDAIEAGFSEYDFLRGTESYKSDWTTQQRRTVSVRVLSPGGGGEWLVRREEAMKQVREVAKRVLPQDMVERVRRLRRRLSAVRG